MFKGSNEEEATSSSTFVQLKKNVIIGKTPSTEE
jgi:hypothetical protein